MALQSIPGGFFWPGHPISHLITTAVGIDVVTINVTNDLAGVVFQMPKTATISQISFDTSASASYTGTAKVQVETVDATNGNATGTLVAAGAEGTIADPNALGWKDVSLDTPPSVTQGTYIYCGVRATNRTGGSFTVPIRYASDHWATTRGFPYPLTDASTKTGQHGNIGIELNDGTKLYVSGFNPATGKALESWNTNSNPNRRGLRFRVPFPTRLTGFWLHSLFVDDIIWELYDTDGTTVLETDTLDNDINFTTGLGFRQFAINPTNITENLSYRLIIFPQDTVSRQYMKTITVNAAADLDSWPGGQNFHQTTVNGAPAAEGDWTNNTTSYPLGIGLQFDAFDDGVGAALMTHPGMAGGMRG